VLTWPVTMPTSRRRVLAAGTGLALTGVAGCGLFDSAPPAPPVPDPLTPLYDSAVALADGYQRTVVSFPGLTDRLTPIAQAHLAHADALRQLLNPLPVPAASGSGAPNSTPAGDENAALEGHRKGEEQAAKDASTACRQAPADRAPLIGSIAAARATHAEALR
jgi:hypothetical protein